MQNLKICDALKWMAASLLLFSGLQSATVFAQDPGNSERAVIEIISIEHRDPLFVRSQLISSLDPRGNIGLVDNKLIIASTFSNLQHLKTLIAESDVPARRLVVSVDFEYGGSRPDNTAQQSSQALEGDLVSFTDSIPGVTSGSVADIPDQFQPRVNINSAIHGDYAEADVEIVNVPGFSGNHTLTLVLGQWYVINPVAEVEESPELLTESETADEMLIINADAAPPVSETVADVAPIAVRVDVLP